MRRLNLSAAVPSTSIADNSIRRRQQRRILQLISVYLAHGKRMFQRLTPSSRCQQNTGLMGQIFVIGGIELTAQLVHDIDRPNWVRICERTAERIQQCVPCGSNRSVFLVGQTLGYLQNVLLRRVGRSTTPRVSIDWQRSPSALF